MCVERFTILDVARINGVEILNKPNTSGDTYAICPFCGDRRGKFSMVVQKNEKSNIYNCYNCGSHGNGVELHMALNGGYDGEDGFNRAVIDIFQVINGNVEFERYHRESVASLDEPNGADKASDEECSRVYYAMLKQLTLKKEHKDDLIRRGLTEEDIVRFRFRSMPENGKGVCRKLLSAGYSLVGVPGFFKDKKGEWCMRSPGGEFENGIYTPGSGYFCPIMDGERNLINGFQIRMDEPTDEKKREKFTKYIWFSSSGKNEGCSSGSPVSYLPGENTKCALVIEGILKSIVVYCLLGGKVSVFGVAGTSSIAGLSSYFERYEDVYLFMAYDMDQNYKVSDLPLLKEAMKVADARKISLEAFLDETLKPEEKSQDKFKPLRKARGITKAAEKLQCKISDYGLDYHSLRWDTDSEGYWKGQYKGLDDFLLEYPYKDKFINYIETKAEQAMVMKRYFNNCSLTA